jgi:hypothetical protein
MSGAKLCPEARPVSGDRGQDLGQADPDCRRRGSRPLHTWHGHSAFPGGAGASGGRDCAQKDKLGLAANVADNVKAFGGLPLPGFPGGRGPVLRGALPAPWRQRGSQRNHVIRASQPAHHPEGAGCGPGPADCADRPRDYQPAEPGGGRALSREESFRSSDGFHALILEDYGKGAADGPGGCRGDWAKPARQGCFVTVDPYHRRAFPSASIRGVSLFKPNAKRGRAAERGGDPGMRSPCTGPERCLSE